MKSSHQTARSYVQGELGRRGYKVAVSRTGPLNVESPNGKKFMIRLFGLKSHNYWIIKDLVPEPDIYCVLTFVYDDETPKYNIWTSQALVEEIENEQEAYRLRQVRKLKRIPSLTA